MERVTSKDLVRCHPDEAPAVRRDASQGARRFHDGLGQVWLQASPPPPSNSVSRRAIVALESLHLPLNAVEMRIVLDQFDPQFNDTINPAAFFFYLDVHESDASQSSTNVSRAKTEQLLAKSMSSDDFIDVAKLFLHTFERPKSFLVIVSARRRPQLDVGLLPDLHGERASRW